jgi:platelet-activating factor acetylhydrolase IB subunit alpha
MDLESRNASLLSELSTSSRSSASSSSGPFLPRTARHTLQSHRAPITRISFHPTWTVLASASEDSTVKIWDWESGDFERTVKGHTKAVMDVDFDPRGNFMGKWARSRGRGHRQVTEMRRDETSYQIYLRARGD